VIWGDKVWRWAGWRSVAVFVCLQKIVSIQTKPLLDNQSQVVVLELRQPQMEGNSEILSALSVVLSPSCMREMFRHIMDSCIFTNGKPRYTLHSGIVHTCRPASILETNRGFMTWRCISVTFPCLWRLRDHTFRMSALPRNDYTEKISEFFSSRNNYVETVFWLKRSRGETWRLLI